MTDMPNENEKESDDQAAPKIIVDSDWKEQVEKEKAAAAAASSEGTVQVPEEEGAETAGAVDDDASQQRALPEPSFEILISMLFTQAISALGQMPNPVDGETSVDKPMAKHSIDMIEMIETKTKGNLSDDESKMIREALHALRMAYVSVRG